jgi:hypothetical protein
VTSHGRTFHGAQHTCPRPHSELDVHEQLEELHVWELGLQQLPAVQSPSEQHSAHAPWQHTCPLPHCESDVQPQLDAPHV